MASKSSDSSHGNPKKRKGTEETDHVIFSKKLKFLHDRDHLNDAVKYPHDTGDNSTEIHTSTDLSMTPVIKQDIKIRKIFTPNMLKTWTLVCKVCGQKIDDEKNHLEKYCSAIRDSQVRMTQKKEKGAKKRRSRRLFAIGQINDTKD